MIQKNINKKGFTLIELLAVITILGILMIIAIPGINFIILNSRKNVYVNDALTYVGAASRFAIDSNNGMDDTDTSYYIHIGNLGENEKASSPWAEWKDAYVGVIFDGKNFEYYWVSSDMAGWRIDLKKSADIVRGDVYLDERKRALNYRQPIAGKQKIVVFDKNGNRTDYSPLVELTREEAKECFSFKDLNDDEIMLTYYNAECGSDVAIPAYVDGKKVVEIYQYTFNSMGIDTVFIPDSIRTIGSRAFAYNNLTNVVIPPSVKTINSEAFLGNKLTNVSMQEGITTIGSSAFKSNKLTVAVIPDSVSSLGSCAYCQNPIPNPSFLYVKSGDGYDYSRIRGYIGDLSEFTEKKFIIPAEVNGVALKRIEDSAFSRVGLSNWEVVIPNTVTHIGNSAFWDNGIAKVNLPSGLTYIGGSAFDNNHLTNIEIPASVTTLGGLAFNRNWVENENQMWIYARSTSGIDYSTLVGYAGKNRANIQIPTTAGPAKTPLKTISGSAFRYLSLTGTVKIPKTVTKIEALAFALNSISNIDNDDGKGGVGPFIYARKSDGSVDYTNLIGYAAFKTDNVDVPSTVKKINTYAFYYSYIKHVNIPEGVTRIENYAFQLCKLEGDLVIPSTVTYIGTKAFEKQITWTSMNGSLNKIINKTGREFNWQSITGGPSAAYFEEGTIENWYGDIKVVKG